MDFDVILQKDFAATTIEYGIVQGNPSLPVVLIKSGYNGSLRGEHDKYLATATDINHNYGNTVICASNPATQENPLEQAINVVDDYCRQEKYPDYQVWYMGYSNGGYLGGRWGYLYPRIRRMLLVNVPVFYNWKYIGKGIERFTGEQITFVYGTLDPSFRFADLARHIKNTCVHLEYVQGADHHFTGELDAFIALPGNYLCRESPAIGPVCRK